MDISLKQFRDRYPTASLTSALLMVHGDQFVVQVTVQTQEGGSATGLAADANLEVAEDHARQRALQGLGIAPAASGTPSPAQPPIPLPHQGSPSEPQRAVPPPRPVSPEKTGNGMATSAPVPDSASTKPEMLQQAHTAPPFVPPPPSQGATNPPLPSSAASPIPTTPESPAAATPPLPAPVNLSDVIAQTDVELRRLGWSVDDGRHHLEKTYGKRSRHELTDEELIEFLCYLEALPDPQPIV